MECVTFLGLVMRIIYFLGDQLVLSMSKLAFIAIAAFLVPTPLTTHFRFIFGLIHGNAAFLLVFRGRVEPKALDHFQLGRSSDLHLLSLSVLGTVIIILLITRTWTVRIVTLTSVTNMFSFGFVEFGPGPSAVLGSAFFSVLKVRSDCFGFVLVERGFEHHHAFGL